jgi:hypothetical protein
VHEYKWKLIHHVTGKFVIDNEVSNKDKTKNFPYNKTTVIIYTSECEDCLAATNIYDVT